MHIRCLSYWPVDCVLRRTHWHRKKPAVAYEGSAFLMGYYAGVTQALLEAKAPVLVSFKLKTSCWKSWRQYGVLLWRLLSTAAAAAAVPAVQYGVQQLLKKGSPRRLHMGKQAT